MTDRDASEARSWSVSTVWAASRAAMSTATVASRANRSASRVSAAPKNPGRSEYKLSAPTGRSGVNSGIEREDRTPWASARTA